MFKRIQQLLTGSIRKQLIVGITLVHAVLMTVFVIDLIDRERDFLVQLSQDQAFGLAETLATNGSSWILAQDFIGIEEVIDSQSEFPSLRYAMFTDLQGHVLGYTDREQVGKYLEDPISKKMIGADPKTYALIDTDGLIDVVSPVFSGDRHIGWSRVGVSRSNIRKNISLVTEKGTFYIL